jgi:hypothetical protein
MPPRKKTLKERASANFAVIVFGLLAVGAAIFCFVKAGRAYAEARRFSNVPPIEDLATFRAKSEGDDVALLGTTHPSNPIIGRDLVYYERWHYVRSANRRTYHWAHAADSKPPLVLALRDGAVLIQGGDAQLWSRREVKLQDNVKLIGLSRDDVVTVMGTVNSTSDPPMVSALFVCGGQDQDCRRGHIGSAYVWAIPGVLALAFGVFMVYAALKG